jgi:biofilm PGA synthesis N-glycosyltransferase PgaC
MTTIKNYLLISPCRNEADYMRQTLDSVVAQSALPAKWVIVDDGSTDDTPRILEEYSARYSWISVVTRLDRGHRAVGPGVIDAFYAGLETVDIDQFQYLCKLDLDLELPHDYFKSIIRANGESIRTSAISPGRRICGSRTELSSPNDWATRTPLDKRSSIEPPRSRKSVGSSDR